MHIICYSVQQKGEATTAAGAIAKCEGEIEFLRGESLSLAILYCLKMDKCRSERTAGANSKERRPSY